MKAVITNRRFLLLIITTSPATNLLGHQKPPEATRSNQKQPEATSEELNSEEHIPKGSVLYKINNFTPTKHPVWNYQEGISYTSCPLNEYIWLVIHKLLYTIIQLYYSKLSNRIEYSILHRRIVGRQKWQNDTLNYVWK